MEKKRTSKTQFKIYLEFLQGNSLLVTGKLTPTENPQDMENLWKKLVGQLNSCGDGPVRDVASWKKVFTEWKSICRKKARENKPLSDLEAAVITLTGSGAVTGLDLKELGVGELNSKLDVEANMSASTCIESSEEKLDDVRTECAGLSTQKKRAAKISYQQYLMYIRFLEMKEENFSKLCEQLNEIPGGSKKSILEWQEAFFKWKRSVQKKAREIYISQQLTGGGFPIPKILTELEEKLLYILGILCINGMLVPELGILSRQGPSSSNKVKKQKKTVKTGLRIKKKKIKATKIQKKVFTSFKVPNDSFENSLKLLVAAFMNLEVAIKRYFSLLK